MGILFKLTFLWWVIILLPMTLCRGSNVQSDSEYHPHNFEYSHTTSNLLINIPINLCVSCEKKILMALANVTNPNEALLVLCKTCHAEKFFLIHLQQIMQAVMKHITNEKQGNFYDRIILVTQNSFYMRPNRHEKVKLIKVPFKNNIKSEPPATELDIAPKQNLTLSFVTHEKEEID